MIHNRESLKKEIQKKLGGDLFIVVSNREPYLHTYSEGGEIICQRPASGMAVALDSVLRTSEGVWIAHGSGNADHEVVNANNKVRVPPENPQYVLKRVWLTKEQEDRYYYGFANEALWPLCHIAYTRPVFNEVDWNSYKEVNRIFADSVCDEIGDKKAFVFIQDYHLALLSGMIKERCPQAITAQFWHIPWPNPEAFRICPWKHELLAGLLGNDMLGFHIRYHCNNFIDTIDREMEAKPDREELAIVYQGKVTKIRSFPISVDIEQISKRSDSPEVAKQIQAVKAIPGLQRYEFLAVSADRLDYTKGIPERLKAVDRFLDKYPQYQKRFVFYQAGVPSRTHIDEYKKLLEEVSGLVEEINWKYRAGAWEPIIFNKTHHSQLELLALFKLADICIVSSLHDGMNLVAKEFISARTDESGALLISEFTGAARELKDAFIINPYAIDQFAESIKTALEMPLDEKQHRMRRLRAIVSENNIYTWGQNIISKLSKIG